MFRFRKNTICWFTNTTQNKIANESDEFQEFTEYERERNARPFPSFYVMKNVIFNFLKEP